jgi:hypothetical protein
VPHVQFWESNKLPDSAKAVLIATCTMATASQVHLSEQQFALIARVVQPSEAGREVRSSSANRGERDRLPCLKDLGLMDLGIEVKHIYPARPLSFKNGANLRLEETKLARIDRP